jgi:hypothetical protein
MTAELSAVAKEVPPNTDLGGLKEQGLVFANITRDQLQNLPALQPKVSAPGTGIDAALSTIASGFGSVTGVLKGATNLAPLTDINRVTNSIGGSAAGADSILQSPQNILGTLSAANSLVNNTVASAAGITNSVGSLGQNFANGLSPASIGLGSVESNINNVSNIAQRGTNLGVSVANQFGSLQSSPLAKLVRDNNIEGTV